MAGNVQALITDILAREGATFTNRDSDRGGPTKFGITLNTLISYLNKPATAGDVANLTEPEARDIYLTLFYRNPRFDKITDPLLAALVVDSGVQHGTQRAAQWLQLALGVNTDGVIGDKTIAMLAAANPSLIYRRVLARRVRFYGDIITNDYKAQKAAGHIAAPLQADNAAGWANRVAGFIEGGA